MQKTIQLGPIKLSNRLPLAFMAGPCVIESREQYLTTVKKLKAIIAKTKHPYILKASYDKANRTSVDAYRGPGLAAGMKILKSANQAAADDLADWQEGKLEPLTHFHGGFQGIQ